MADTINQAGDVPSGTQPHDLNEKWEDADAIENAGPDRDTEVNDGKEENSCLKQETDLVDDICNTVQSGKLNKAVTFEIAAGMTLQLQKITRWLHNRRSIPAEEIAVQSSTPHGGAPTDRQPHEFRGDGITSGNLHNEVDRGVAQDVLRLDWTQHGSCPSRDDQERYHGGAKDSLWNTNRQVPPGLRRMAGGAGDDEDSDKGMDGSAGGSGGGDDGDKGGGIYGVYGSGVKLDLSAAVPPAEIVRPVPALQPKMGILRRIWNSGVVLEKARSNAVYAFESKFFNIFPHFEGPHEAASNADERRRLRLREFRCRLQHKLKRHPNWRKLRDNFLEREKQRQLELDRHEIKRNCQMRSPQDLDALMPPQFRPIVLRRTWRVLPMPKSKRHKRWVTRVPWHNNGIDDYFDHR